MSLTTEAFERIRHAIVSGALEFGEPLSETQIAAALGMSKAPVRGAFIVLRDKGLVEIIPQSGTYVFSPTADDVVTLSHFRALLENEALREAMKRHPATLLRRLNDAIDRMKTAMARKDWDAYRAADSNFHHAIMEEADNRYMLQAYDLGAPALEALRVRLQRAGNIRQQSFGEHIDMARMLRDGDIKGAGKLLHAHILVITESLDTLPLRARKGSRRDQPATRSYAEIFRRTSAAEREPPARGKPTRTRRTA